MQATYDLWHARRNLKTDLDRISTVIPNEQGQCLIAELELEVALLDSWVRYWFRGKRLPLPADVGAALVDYLRQDRPACATRRVFIRIRAPKRGFVSPSVVCCIVHRALKRAGLTPEFKGAHLLRHSLATDLLRRGASLVEIGQLLRHSQPNTTQIYAKVDIAALRAIALPWSGVAS